MQQENNDIGAIFKQLNIIYAALGASMMMTVMVFYFLVSSGNVPSNDELRSTFMMVVPVVGVSTFMLGKYLYDMNAQKSKAEQDEKVKLAYYRTSLLIAWATTEGSALFSGVAYLLSGDQLFLAFFALIFLGFIYRKPSPVKFQQDF